MSKALKFEQLELVLDRAPTFEDMLEFGEDGERELARYLCAKGFIVDPRYQYHKKGAPMLFGMGSAVIAPDLRADKPGCNFFADSKRKTRWVYWDHAHHGEPETGCDLRHFNAYDWVQQNTGLRVALFFLHDQKQQLGGEQGVFWGWLDELKERVRLWDGYTPSGRFVQGPMAFFPATSLRRVEDWHEVLEP